MYGPDHCRHEQRHSGHPEYHAEYPDSLDQCQPAHGALYPESEWIVAGQQRHHELNGRAGREETEGRNCMVVQLGGRYHLKGSPLTSSCCAMKKENLFKCNMSLVRRIQIHNFLHKFISAFTYVQKRDCHIQPSEKAPWKKKKRKARFHAKWSSSIFFSPFLLNFCLISAGKYIPPTHTHCPLSRGSQFVLLPWRNGKHEQSQLAGNASKFCRECWSLVIL